MNRIATALAALLVGMAALAPSPASADEAAPTMYVPLSNADGSPAHVVHVQADRLTWRFRKAARTWDALIPGLEVLTTPCVPDVPCVRVHVGTYPADTMLPGDWWALTTYPAPLDRVVYLNRAVRVTDRDARFRVVMHEMGHVLGLAHHTDPAGVMAVPARRMDDATPSPEEVALLVAYYAG